MNKEKKIVIIGGGIAGLSAGVYARMNGYDTVILEQHSIPGGLCTAWKRNGYTIDGCLHWLIGSGAESSLRKVWDELGALDGVEFVNHEVMTSIEVETENGRKDFIVYTDADRFNTHLKEISPQDSGAIDEFTALVKKFSRFDMNFDKPRELMGFRDAIRMMRTMGPYLKDLSSMSKLTVTEYASRFQSKALREGLCAIINMSDFSFMALLMIMGWMHGKNAGYPVGGSLNLIRNVERRYLGLGGKILYGQKAARIITEKGRATGVALEDGTTARADIVISAADGYSTIFRMLGGRYTSRAIRRNYAELPLFEPFFMLSLGVRRDFSGTPPLLVQCLDEPIILEGKKFDKIGFKHNSFDPTFAPAGKTVVQVIYAADYDYWKRLEGNRSAYEDEKKSISETLITALETRWPGIRGDIEMTDAATPLTWERYTSNRRGTFEGWLMTPKTAMMTIKKTLPGLKNFYMAGQWVQPGGGVPSSAKSGRDVIEILCARDKKTFIHDAPRQDTPRQVAR